jgi:hypothetical protein
MEKRDLIKIIIVRFKIQYRNKTKLWLKEIISYCKNQKTIKLKLTKVNYKKLKMNF